MKKPSTSRSILSFTDSAYGKEYRLIATRIIYYIRMMNNKKVTFSDLRSASNPNNIFVSKSYVYRPMVHLMSLGLLKRKKIGKRGRRDIHKYFLTDIGLKYDVYDLIPID